MLVDLEAEYENPYDARQVRLDGIFKGPDRTEITVPGFWDGKEAWRVRFTPSKEGEWTYKLYVNDWRGPSYPVTGSFKVTASGLHGWIQAGNWYDPDYSGHYLVYQDGTPFYGVGHCDALNILIDGFNVDEGVGLFNNMKAAGENFVVWWPGYSNSIINNHYDDYNVSNLVLIDLIVKDAQEKNIFLIFTVWDHPQLRDSTHAWGDGRWEGFNAFSKLSDINSFFTAAEPWEWQKNYYRYIIARWGYSPAIGMWQTVSEINGTNSYGNTDSWHKKLNDFFVENDPYRHPTTASRSGGIGDVAWPEGHKVMDSPQVHIYDELGTDAVGAARVIAKWTLSMWQQNEKPNWIGEFGVSGNTYYPELFHNSIWAALGAGAAMTPAEWNSGGQWMQMSPEMYADQGRLAQFVADLPLARWDPVALEISSSDPQVRGWGVAGEDGGLFWVQDFSMEGRAIQEVREYKSIQQGVRIDIQGLSKGEYLVTPYDTWQGTFLDPFTVECKQKDSCTIYLPDFKSDMAFKLVRQ